ncbi:MFS transporter [Alkalihalobacillus sp. EGI L200015]|nr:MFS transporter [Pseudalkalibacillus salsuginis]MCF6409393.1 MFS transporter [Pseudalkalibacillus salsuginis]
MYFGTTTYRVWKKEWKNPSLLLAGIGISNLGDWIYLIALNLMILNVYGSAAAVAGLYLLKPFASLLTSFWSGSIIDRFDKRRIMIMLDVIRAGLVAFIPFFSSILLIYLCVLLVNMGSSFFHPTATTYITELVPGKRRKRFNSLHNLMSSGAFVIGPAIAGALVFIGSPELAIYMNALSFLISGLIIVFLPGMDTKGLPAGERLDLQVIKEDWRTVLSFSKKAAYVMGVYALFEITMVFTAALDSTEVVFTRRVLGLTEGAYGALVSIAGIGFIAGSVFVTIFADKIPLRHLIGIGTLMSAVGYLIYAFSTSLVGGSVGFFILSFALAAGNTGFITFYQNNLPVGIMGRVISIINVFQSLFQIVLIIVIGLAVEVFTIQTAVIAGSFLMLLIAITLVWLTTLPTKTKYFMDSKLTSELRRKENARKNGTT